jgi:Protein of unknown function (DUF2783)
VGGDGQFNRVTRCVKIDPNIGNADEFYAELVRLHDGLDDRESLKLNAKIILLLANQVGDPRVLSEVLTAAAGSRDSKE